MITKSRTAIRWLAGAFLALAAWFAGLVALTALAEPTNAVIVFASDKTALIRAITNSDVALLDGSERMVRVSGRSPGFVAGLYASGAWLVLPARAGGCVTPQRAQAVRNRANG